MNTPSETTKPTILRPLPNELVGPRVIVRPYRDGDGQALWDAVTESREHLLPWMPWVDSHQSPDDSEAYARGAMAKWILRDEMPLSIWERQTGRYLGGTGFHRIKWSIPSCHIGYWIRASAEGNGYVTETVKLLCKLAFETLDAKRVEIRCDTTNARSAAVPRRLGFVNEATLRNDSLNTAGALTDTFIFALTPEDYDRVRGGW